jgi:hypothetical protein
VVQGDEYSLQTLLVFYDDSMGIKAHDFPCYVIFGRCILTKLLLSCLYINNFCGGFLYCIFVLCDVLIYFLYVLNIYLCTPNL